MTEQCIICKNEIEEVLPGKFSGTIVKINKNTSTGRGYVCRDCQKEYGDKLKEIIDKI
ncbi:MAG: hypothetical protein AABW91_04230 [Nanoarchaeota archaeon]